MHGGRESVSSLCLTGSKLLVIVQLLSCVRLLVTPWTAACQASLSFTISQNLFKFMSTESEIPSNHLIFCHPFFFCLQSFPASGSFLISRLFTSDGQTIEASVSASVLLLNIQDWFPLGMTGLISLQCKGPSRVFSNTTVQKHEFFSVQTSLWSNSHILIWLLEKPWLWLHEPMATQSSALAWRIPGMVQPGGLPSVRSHRVGHDWSDLAAAAAYEPQQSNVSAF